MSGDNLLSFPKSFNPAEAYNPAEAAQKQWERESSSGNTRPTSLVSEAKVVSESSATPQEQKPSLPRNVCFQQPPAHPAPSGYHFGGGRSGYQQSAYHQYGGGRGYKEQHGKRDWSGQAKGAHVPGGGDLPTATDLESATQAMSATEAMAPTIDQVLVYRLVMQMRDAGLLKEPFYYGVMDGLVQTHLCNKNDLLMRTLRGTGSPMERVNKVLSEEMEALKVQTVLTTSTDPFESKQTPFLKPPKASLDSSDSSSDSSDDSDSEDELEEQEEVVSECEKKVKKLKGKYSGADSKKEKKDLKKKLEKAKEKLKAEKKKLENLQCSSDSDSSEEPAPSKKADKGKKAKGKGK